MKNICLISDTHGKIESWVFKHFEDSDEIWHCGDLGSISIIDSINKNFKFRAVYGNIDNAQIRRSFKKNLVFKVEDIKVLILSPDELDNLISCGDEMLDAKTVTAWFRVKQFLNQL